MYHRIRAEKRGNVAGLFAIAFLSLSPLAAIAAIGSIDLIGTTRNAPPTMGALEVPSATLPAPTGLTVTLRSSG